MRKTTSNRFPQSFKSLKTTYAFSIITRTMNDYSSFFFHYGKFPLSRKWVVICSFKVRCDAKIKQSRQIKNRLSFSKASDDENVFFVSPRQWLNQSLTEKDWTGPTRLYNHAMHCYLWGFCKRTYVCVCWLANVSTRVKKMMFESNQASQSSFRSIQFSLVFDDQWLILIAISLGK